MKAIHVTALAIGLVGSTALIAAQPAPVTVTHGPMLGQPGSDRMTVWVRTSAPGSFQVRYGLAPETLDQLSAHGATTLERDHTGTITLEGLKSNTTYFYRVETGASAPGPPDGSFMTLPASTAFGNPEHNPKGLFNFRFEFGTGNNQNPGGQGPWPPAFKTMLDTLKGKVHFAIQNGDFIYEEKRDYSVADWRTQVGLAPGAKSPRVVEMAPTIVGVWENYKLYLSRGKALAAWHRNVPGLFTFDDHEIIDNIDGTATVGLRDRKAVFRDIGSQAWYDYLGWANPVAQGEIRIGRARLKAGSDILTDPEADFVAKPVDLNVAGGLHVHWGGPIAGVPNREFEPKSEAEKAGDPNAGVYEVLERLDAHRLRIRPAATRDGEVAYSLGRNSYYEQQIGNAHFIYLDTRSYRNEGDARNPARPDVSMLGARQKAWLMETMKKSDADMFFVVSQVTLTIPHVGGTPTAGPSNVPAGPRPVVHDEAWPIFLAEREELIEFWDSLGKPVMVLTGDLHNSFSIKVTDRVWELASGPHNSRNHRADAQGDAPPNGRFDSRGRKVDIRWSSHFLADTPAQLVRQPIYTVVQLNNVFNNPLVAGQDRWVAYPHPHVIVQFFNGLTGDLLYAESIRVK